jgi:arginyl-tRNA synthetase
MVEYSAPNTNKPLHLGHVRNNVLGASLCRILAAAGDEVIPVNLVNDRGIHIAKSMVAYRRWGGGQTPDSAGRKGDHFVGDFYVRFNQALREETDRLAVAGGLDPAALDEDARRALEDRTALMAETREELRRWEDDDPEARGLWRTMNAWVYAGFDATYARLGCVFRKWYLESETYRRGKALVEDGLERGLFERRADGSVWARLEAEGLKDKLLLRSDGTSVYITQDLGTAILKFEDFRMDRSVYVVGSEQILHFQILFALLDRLGLPWARGCRHLSYGLVTLPHGLGKLKSREGQAVDADDLLDELAALARRKAQEGGYVTDLDIDLDALGDAIGQGALKMFLLQVSAEKNIQFDPGATLDFEGDTGPAVQYSHARICSIGRKALAEGRIATEDLCFVDAPDPFAGLGTGAPGAAPARRDPDAAGDAPRAAHAAGLVPERVAAQLLVRPEEKALALELARFPVALRQAAEQLSPSPVAGHLLELTKTYARFYHNCPVLRADTEELMRARLHLCLTVAATLRRGLGLLGIRAPEAM